jgi:hypothetical protein
VSLTPRFSLFRLALSAVSLAALLAAASGCAPDTEVEVVDPTVAEEPLTRVSSGEQAEAAAESLGSLRFERLTPTSERVVRAARYWMRTQDRDARYPKARMCASNVSKVLFLAGVYGYDQEGVRRLLDDVRVAGGRVTALPISAGDRAKLAAALNQVDQGRLPAGTLVAGMNVNTSLPGDQHIGFIGHTDPDGTVWIYHNNWYRPENEGGARRPYMVSDANLARGFPRQWMATPWVKVTRDASGRITQARSLLPQIDDMDPMSSEYRMTLAILPEVAGEMARGQVR